VIVRGLNWLFRQRTLRSCLLKFNPRHMNSFIMRVFASFTKFWDFVFTFSSQNHVNGRFCPCFYPLPSPLTRGTHMLGHLQPPDMPERLLFGGRCCSSSWSPRRRSSTHRVGARRGWRRPSRCRERDAGGDPNEHLIPILHPCGVSPGSSPPRQQTCRVRPR
jgi:hypothetical protein